MPPDAEPVKAATLQCHLGFVVGRQLLAVFGRALGTASDASIAEVRYLATLAALDGLPAPKQPDAQRFQLVETGAGHGLCPFDLWLGGRR